MEKLYQCLRCLEFFQRNQIVIYVQLSRIRLGGLCYPCLHILEKSLEPKTLDDNPPKES